MKRKIPITISILAILALSACGGGDATPEISAEDIAATAVAQAWLVMTQTAAAVEHPAADLGFIADASSRDDCGCWFADARLCFDPGAGAKGGAGEC